MYILEIIRYLINFISFLAAGGLSEWYESISCDATCGYGTITQTRTCTDPLPVAGDTTVCALNYDETRTVACYLTACPGTYFSVITVLDIGVCNHGSDVMV